MQHKWILRLAKILALGGFVGCLLFHILAIVYAPINYDPLAFAAFSVMFIVGVVASFITLSPNQHPFNPDYFTALKKFFRIRAWLAVYAMLWLLLGLFSTPNRSLLDGRFLSAFAIAVLSGAVYDIYLQYRSNSRHTSN